MLWTYELTEFEIEIKKLSKIKFSLSEFKMELFSYYILCVVLLRTKGAFGTSTTSQLLDQQNSVKEDVQKLFSELKMLRVDLMKAKDTFNEKISEKIISHIQGKSNETNVMCLFKELTDKTLIVEIVKNSYINDLEILNRLLEFLKFTAKTHFSYPILGLSTLLQLLQNNQQSNFSNLLLISSSILEESPKNPLYNCEIKNNLEVELSQFHANNDYTEFIDFVNQNKNRQQNKRLIKSFVRFLYQKNPINILKILNFQSEFKRFEDKLSVIEALLSEVVSNEHDDQDDILAIVYYVVKMKELVKLPKDKATLEDIQSSLPANVQTLLYSHLCFENRQFKGENLMGIHNNESTRYYLSPLPRGQSLSLFFFALDFVKGANGSVMVITNQFSRGKFYFNHEKLSRNSRPKLPKPYAHWKISLADRGQYFRIMNKNSGKYLHATTDLITDQLRALIELSDNKTDTGMWKIQLCMPELK